MESYKNTQLLHEQHDFDNHDERWLIATQDPAGNVTVKVLP